MLGLILGYVGHDIRYDVNRYTYSEVQVLERYDDTHFKVQPAWMESYNWTTCKPVNWQKNQKMQFVYYSQMVGCKDVSLHGAYKFYEENGIRKIYPQEMTDARF